jgi:DNA-binding transcriptional LysR family regulator
MALKMQMLRCFAKVAQHGNLADAAAEMGRTAPAVSMMLKQLEAHLGQPLFEADRKNRLSPVGVFVLEQALNQLHHFDQTVQAIDDFANAGRGLVRIATVPSVAGTILPIALERFIVDYPRVRIELRDMDSASVLGGLEQERVDIGIASVLAPVLAPVQKFNRTQIYSDEFGIVCSHAHRFARESGPLQWREIKGEIFIANELCASIQSPVFRESHQHANLQVHNTVSLLSMVKAGLGVTVLPRLVVQLHPGETVFRPIADPRAFRRIDLLRRHRHTLSPAADTMIRYILSAATDFREASHTPCS